jgi:hypothetical protein
MKSPEVYKRLRGVLGPWFKAEGFRRGDGPLSWTRPSGELHVTGWCQISRDGWDPYSGSRFTVELQRGRDPRRGTAGQRRRLPSFASDAERETIRRIQNGVIAMLTPRPAGGSLIRRVIAVVRGARDQKLEPVTKPYRPNADIWLRYGRPEDLDTWSELILGMLPRCVAEVESWPPER